MLHPDDVGLTLTAFRERWPMTDEKRKELLDGMFDLACADGVKPSVRVNAFKAILEAQRQDLDRDRAMAALIIAGKLGSSNSSGGAMQSGGFDCRDLAEGLSTLENQARAHCEREADSRGLPLAMPVVTNGEPRPLAEEGSFGPDFGLDTMRESG